MMLMGSSWRQAAEVLGRGGVIVLPTDTVYGLAARAEDPLAVGRLYVLKNRQRKPGTVIAANPSQLLDLGIDPAEVRRAAKFWPGPVSVVLPGVPHYLHQDTGGVAARVTADHKLKSMLELTGPLITSSANLPACTPARDIPEARRYFGDKVDYYLDGGVLPVDASSAVVRIGYDGAVEVLRAKPGLALPEFV